MNDGLMQLMYALPLCVEHAAKTAYKAICGKETQHWSFRHIFTWTTVFTHSARGFGGMGTNGPSPSHFIVIREGNFYAVYVGGDFAYALDKPTPLFLTRLKDHAPPLLSNFREEPEKWCDGVYELGRWRGA